METSRRQFLSSFMLGGLALAGGALRLAFAQTDSDISGYPLSLASGVPRAAWSALPGETVHFALSATHHESRDLRMLAANGATVHEFGTVKFGEQRFMTDRPWLDGAGFAPTVSWTIPPHQPSGVYFLNGLPELFVIVRAPLTTAGATSTAGTVSTAVLVPTNTINAYSTTDGRSLYAEPQRVPEVSFLRPFNASIRQNWTGTLAWLHGETLLGQPRFLADADLDDGRELKGVELLIVIGHSEYWSRKARLVFDQFIDQGGHAILASGNMMWWQVRYADQDQQLICYKDYDPHFGKDPESNALLVTESWTSASLKYSIIDSIGGDFDHGGYGARRAGSNVKGKGLRVVDPHHPLFAGQGLSSCEDLDFGGVDEYDGAPIQGLDARGLPIPAETQAGSRLEIVAYEWSERGGATLATAHLYQPHETSGVMFHLGAPEATNGPTSGCAAMRRAAHEFARRVLHKLSPFGTAAPGEVVHALRTPWPHALPVIAGQCGPPR